MLELANLIAGKKYNNTAKLIAILDYLGGQATTVEIKNQGISAGAKSIGSWNVASLLGAAQGRVTRLPTGWLLLDAGRDYLSRAGIAPKSGAPDTAGERKKATSRTQSVPSSGILTVAIGHGRSAMWKDLRDFAKEKLALRVVEFNSRVVVGLANKERLNEMLAEADLAFVILTAEDEQADGSVHARQNVIHEAGLFQGRLGFEKVALLLEESCEEFSNIHGLGQIRFPRGNVTAVFEQIRDFVAERGTEKLLSSTNA